MKKVDAYIFNDNGTCIQVSASSTADDKFEALSIIELNNPPKIIVLTSAGTEELRKAIAVLSGTEEPTKDTAKLVEYKELLFRAQYMLDSLISNNMVGIRSQDVIRALYTDINRAIEVRGK
jgi:hypothetical protein